VPWVTLKQTGSWLHLGPGLFSGLRAIIMETQEDSTQFGFSWEENRAMQMALECKDTRANHYIAELERIAPSYAALRGFSGERRIPPAIREHLENLAKISADLTSALYALPDEVRQLLTMHLISEDTSARLSHDLDDLGRPLADLAGLIRQLLKGKLDGDLEQGQDQALVLIKVLARAYRNHFNVTVSATEPEQFIRSVRLFLEAMAQRKMADADQLLERLESLLASALAED
jgi:hypothetical protein